MFHTTLNGEYEIARREFGFTDPELRGLAENSFRYAFKAAYRSSDNKVEDE
jgi:adenosine deaminase